MRITHNVAVSLEKAERSTTAADDAVKKYAEDHAAKVMAKFEATRVGSSGK